MGNPPNITYAPDDSATIAFLKEWQDDNDYILAHTSGSTGKPKDIRLLKSDMIASARSTCRYFDISAESLLVCPLSARYIAGKMMIVRAIVSGATLVMESPSNMPATSPYASTISLMAIVPSQLNGLIASKRINRIDNIIIGGAPLSPVQLQAIIDNGFNAYATYGMTETCSHVALKHIDNKCDTYTALPGYSFTLDNRDCLVIHSLTQSFGSLATNDMATVHNPYSFTWLGRYDNVIISGGLKVYPETVERIVSPYINQEFYISSAHDDKWGQQVVLNIEGAPYDTTRLLAQLKSILEPHQLPRRVVFHDYFSRTDSGKIKR